MRNWQKRRQFQDKAVFALYIVCGVELLEVEFNLFTFIFKRIVYNMVFDAINYGTDVGVLNEQKKPPRKYHYFIKIHYIHFT